ncbi:MAG: BamA/TamA family outer membrane protein [Cytophagaceae bacterium]|nr:BamA/TamA family outer membrane protein [Cytophagaceae bacterium]MDW8455266.1 BamA/TamA family outer membrane protein [Cytophagaceae bacterium]
MLTSSCSVHQHLKKNEYLVWYNSIKGAPKGEEANLASYIQQKPNKKILHKPIPLSLYFLGKSFYDTVEIQKDIDHLLLKYDSVYLSQKHPQKQKKILKQREKKLSKLYTKKQEGNLFMRTMGEPPVIYDSSKTSYSAGQLSTYLFSKGYFKNQVFVKTDTLKKKRIKTTYYIQAGLPCTVNQIEFIIEDTAIFNLVNKERAKMLIKKNEQYEAEKLTNERERLYKLMKDNGYFDFNRQFIYFELDTIRDSVNITVHIQNPPSGNHKIYRLKEMYFNLDVGIEYARKFSRDTFDYGRIRYTYLKKNYLRKLLDYKIRTRPMDIYSQSKIQHTQRLLGALDIFKFVNINFEKYPDTSNNYLRAFINTSPMSRMQLSQEYGLSIGQAWVPGPFFTIALKQRNLFNALDITEYSLRYSIDGQPSITDKNVYYTKEFGANASVTLPQLLIPSRFRDKVSDYNPKVKMLVGYNNVSRQEYKRENLKAQVSYSFDLDSYSHLFITPIDVNIIGSKVSPLFDDFLQNLRSRGSNLYLSFKPSIVTSFHAAYVFNNHDITYGKRTWFLRPTIEIGGLVPSIAGNMFSPASAQDSNLLFNKQYFEFFRIGFDGRIYFPAGKKNTFVLRINTGLVRPFGVSLKSGLTSLPYEKYFFSGGGNSIRAWKPRRLGPGTYKDTTQGKEYLFEQPGDILMEANAEYRFDIIKFFDGALFVDAGNVWTIKDTTRPGSEFRYLKSMADIAVGAGFGIRLDFSFLIIRLDLAQKIIDPAKPYGQRLIQEFKLMNTAFNIGIGYPF